jgi:hypothetical protein
MSESGIGKWAFWEGGYNLSGSHRLDNSGAIAAHTNESPRQDRNGMGGVWQADRSFA